MRVSVATEFARLSQRIRIALFCEHAVLAAIVLAGVVGSAVLIARVFESHWPPQWWWLGAIAGAAVCYGVVQAWRLGWTADQLVVQVDRRHKLGGLLVTSLECDTAEWNSELEERVRESSGHLPSLHPLRWFGRAAAIAVFATGIAMLPEPETPRDQSLVARELERIADDVELALEAGSIDESDAEELRDRVGEMQQMLQDGQEVDWSDADGLGERLDHEESVRLDRLKSLRAELGEFAAADDATGKGAQQDLLSALEQAQNLGLTDELPEEFSELLEKMQDAADAQEAGEAGEKGEAGFDASQLDLTELGLDGAALNRLAQNLQKAADGQAGKLEQFGKLNPDDLENLSDILAKAKKGMQGNQPGQGQGQGKQPMPGNGGVDRGRGDALLQMNGQSGNDTSKLDVQRLPPGQAAPREWARVGMRRTVPEVDPTRDTSPGSGAAEGGGRVTWRRRLAPRHRDAVRKFFTSRGKQPPK